MRRESEAALAVVEHLVAMRRPGRWEAALVATTTLFVASLRRYLFSRRFVVLSALFLLPTALILLARGFASETEQNSSRWFSQGEFAVLLTLIPTGFLPFAAAACCGGMIGDEVEEQTLTYLLVRPLPRWGLYIAKLLALWITVVILAAIFTTVGYLCLFWGREELIPAILPVRAALVCGLMALAAAAYCGLFALIGLLTRRSLIVGIFYILVCEVFLAAIPFNFRMYTVVFYFRILAIRTFELNAADWGIVKLEDAATTVQSVAVLIGIALVSALFGALLTMQREFRMKTPVGA